MMRVFSQLVLAIALAVSASAAQAATYYLDPVNGAATCSATGHTGCNGTACRTFTALSGRVTFAAGDVVRFCSGDYRETVVVPANGLSLEAAPGATPVIRGTDRCSSWTSEGDGVYRCSFTPTATFNTEVGISHLFVDGAPLPEYQANNCPSPISLLASFKSCSNYPAKTCTADSQCSNLGGVSGGTCRNGTWCWNQSTNTVYVRKTDGSSPAGNVVEVGSRHRLLDVGGRSNIKINGLTFFGGDPDGTGQWDPVINASGVGGSFTFTNNVMEYPGLCAVFQSLSSNANIVVTGNTFSNVGQGVSFLPTVAASNHGLPLWRLQCAGRVCDSNFSNNTMINNGTHNWARGVGPGDCGASNSDRCWAGSINTQETWGRIIVDNNVATNVEAFFTLKLCNYSVNAGSSISGNRITCWPKDPGKDGFCPSLIDVHCEKNSNGICSGTSVDCSAVPNPKPVWRELKIMRNRVLGGRKTIEVTAGNLQAGDDYTVLVANNYVKGGDRAWGWTSNASLLVSRGSSGVRVYNNTLACTSNGSLISVGGQDSSNSGGDAAVDFKNNLLLTSTCNSGITDHSTSDVWDAATNVCSTAISGKCVTGADSVIFANPATADFQVIGGTGPVEGRATTVPDFADDYMGAARTVPWDIGANEFTATGQPAAPILLSVDPLP